MHVLACAAALFALAPAVASAEALAASPPTATTGPAQQVHSDTAVLTGSVNPNGSATSYYFEYGPTAAYGVQTSAVQAGSGNAEVSARATLSGLEPSTGYHYRLVAVGEGAKVVGDDATFTTPAAPPPSLSTDEAKDVTTSSAVLSGTIDPAGIATSYYFEYGVKALTTRTPSGSAGAGTKGLAVSATLTGLAPYTVYEYRLVAVGAHTVLGGIHSFKTRESPPQPPRLSLTSLADPVGAGYEVTFAGTLSGSDVGVRDVALEIEPYPYTSGFAQYGAVELTGAGGAFSFALPDVTIDTRVRAVTVGGSPSLVSATTLEQAFARISVHLHRHGHTVRFAGLIAPASAPVTVEIQRRAGRRWRTIAHTAPHPIAGDLGAFSLAIGHPRHGDYRVRAIVGNGSLLPGSSRVLKIG